MNPSEIDLSDQVLRLVDDRCDCDGRGFVVPEEPFKKCADCAKAVGT